MLLTKPLKSGDLYTRDLRLLDIDNFQNKDRIFKIQVYSYYKRFLEDLANPRNFYLVDIYQKISHFNEITRDQDVLAEKINNGVFDCGENHGVLLWDCNSESDKFISGIRTFTYDDINLEPHVTKQQIHKIYRLYKELENKK